MVEASHRITPHHNGVTTMFDPAVLGTAIIGLESVRLDAEQPARPQQPSARRRPYLGQVRRSLAAILRRTAEATEPAKLATP
jgi:hypothetical protein